MPIKCQNNKIFMPDASVSVRYLGTDGDYGVVLFKSDNGVEKTINATGFFIWNRIDGICSAADIAGDVLKNFDFVPRDHIKDDVYEFLDQLESEGFVSEKFPGNEPVSQTAPVAGFHEAPKSLDLSLTGKCNLHCAYCFYHDEMAARPDLPAEAWLDFFDELGRLAVRDVSLSGGEVFTRKDLWELIDGIIANKMRYSLSSNGTLIDEKTLYAFEQTKRRTRLNSIQVSIDGSCAEVHDKSRGAGTFKKAVYGLRVLKEAGFPVTVRVTVNRHNVDDLDNVVHFLLDDIGLSSIGTNDAMPMGSGCENQKTIVLTASQQVTAMKTLARLSDKYKGRINATAGPLAKWRMYQEMEHAMATGEKSKRWKMGYLTACGCMYQKLSVHQDGIITPCNMLTKLVLGKINQDSLSEIWKTHPVLQELKDRRQIPMTEVAGCEDCKWAPYCNGSCPGLAFEMTGDFNRANPHDCYRCFLEQTGGMDYTY